MESKKGEVRDLRIASPPLPHRIRLQKLLNSRLYSHNFDSTRRKAGTKASRASSHPLLPRPASLHPFQPPTRSPTRYRMPLAPPEEQRPLLEPLDSSISQKTLSPLGSERPRSIRSLASYGATERAPSPSPEPEGRPGRKTKKESGNRCLCISVSILLAVCVYASFVEDFMGDVETAISCATCIGLLAPLQALAHVGDDAFVDLFVGFCTKLGVRDLFLLATDRLVRTDLFYRFMLSDRRLRCLCRCSRDSSSNPRSRSPLDVTRLARSQELLQHSLRSLSVAEDDPSCGKPHRRPRLTRRIRGSFA